MLHILEPGGRYFFRQPGSSQGVLSNETKSLAHRPVCHGAPPLHWQCLCLERPYEAHYGIYGIYPQRNDVDLFPGHPLPRPVSRLPGQFCPPNRSSQVRSLIHDLLRYGYVRYGSGALCTQPAHALRLLWRHRRCRSGNYITPVSTLVKWFPENRGFATGLAIMGFGFASLIAGPAMQLLVQHFGLVANFIILGCVYLVVMTASSLYLAPPAVGDVPAKAEKEASVEYADAQPQFTVRQAMKTWQFYAIWWLFFTNITCGIALLSVASPMAQDVVGMSPMAAASMVGFIGLMNGAGRIAWATISDYLGRSATYVLFFIIEILAFWQLAGVTGAFSFQVLVLLIISCYGGGFSCMPAYLSDLFGTKYLSAIHGRILTAWGAAGVAGPLVLSLIKENTNSYTVTLYFFVGAFTVALALMLFLKYRTRHGIACVAEAR